MKRTRTTIAWICGSLSVQAHAQGLAFQESFPPDGAGAVPLDTEIRLRFSAQVDPSSVSSDTVKLLRGDTGASLPGTLTVQGNTISIAPLYQYFARAKYPEWEGVEWTGLKPATSYRIWISPKVGGTKGVSLGKERNLLFSTMRVDWGIYWLDAESRAVKHRDSLDSSFYDPTKPVVLYVHGWQGDTSQADFRRENPFFYNSKHFEFHNAVPDWKEHGYNVGIFYWSQWADEPEVRDAEAKVWAGNNRHKAKDGKLANMRYRVRDGSFEEYSIEKSVSEHAFESFAQSFQDYRGPGIHIVGHSLGSQLAVSLTRSVSDAVLASALPESLHPRRLTLLDPFWSKGGKEYLRGKSPAEICAAAVRDFTQRGGVADVYKSSPLGGAVGDENLPLRRHVAFARLWPDFISIVDAVYQHVFAYIWFAKSIVSPIPAGSGALGAAAEDEEIRSLMNGEGKPLRFWYTDGPGTKTLTTEDDHFASKSGVSTW